MFSIFDIGAAPANEDCAQIGQTNPSPTRSTKTIMS
jgi:hypothetical protein